MGEASSRQGGRASIRVVVKPCVPIGRRHSLHTWRHVDVSACRWRRARGWRRGLRRAAGGGRVQPELLERMGLAGAVWLAGVVHGVWDVGYGWVIVGLGSAQTQGPTLGGHRCVGWRWGGWGRGERALPAAQCVMLTTEGIRSCPGAVLISRAQPRALGLGRSRRTASWRGTTASGRLMDARTPLSASAPPPDLCDPSLSVWFFSCYCALARPSRANPLASLRSLWSRRFEDGACEVGKCVL